MSCHSANYCSKGDIIHGFTYFDSMRMNAPLLANQKPREHPCGFTDFDNKWAHKKIPSDLRFPTLGHLMVVIFFIWMAFFSIRSCFMLVMRSVWLGKRSRKLENWIIWSWGFSLGFVLSTTQPSCIFIIWYYCRPHWPYQTLFVFLIEYCEGILYTHS